MPTPIFYDPNQSVAGLATYSPSAGKPARFIELADYRGSQAGIRHPIHSFEPVTKEDLDLVHNPEYVDGVFNGTISNGFENNDPRVPPSCLWTIGSLLAASRAALADPAQPACSPTSGFHHAHYGFGGGFCTFNGLLVVAAKLLQEKPHLKIGILDCDFHYGDGTDDILKRKPELAKSIVHHTGGKHLYPEHDSDEYFQWLHLAINDINRKECDLVLYQAGADAHKDDPLGGILNTRDLTLRDRLVFGRVRSAIAWNFAGGYQQNPSGSLVFDPVLQIHWNTLCASDIAGRARGYARD